MKPAPFRYVAAQSLEEALALLQEYGDEGKLLAGGQSLLPLLNMRLTQPAVLIDINPIRELSYIRRENGVLRVGALTRQRELERHEDVLRDWPCLAAGVEHIGYFQIRNRGTVGGSLAHADPSAELAVLAAAYEAEFYVQSEEETRVIPAEEFFLTYLTTSMMPHEMLTEIRFPAQPSHWSFQELARRPGDFALVSTAVLFDLDSRGNACNVRIAVGGVDATPVRLRNAEASLEGRPLDEEALEEAARLAQDEVEPESDVQASAAYRKRVVGVLVRRALIEALSRPQAAGRMEE